MTPAELKSWIQGFDEANGGAPPTAEQWKAIKAKIELMVVNPSPYLEQVRRENPFRSPGAGPNQIFSGANFKAEEAKRANFLNTIAELDKLGLPGLPSRGGVDFKAEEENTDPADPRNAKAAGLTALRAKLYSGKNPNG